MSKLRKLFNERRIGHAGTLDPDATGVMVVGVGYVTRLMQFLSGMDKTYTCEVVFGSETNTLDDSGIVLPALPFRANHGGFAAWLIYDTEAMSAMRPQASISGNDPESKIPAFRYTSSLANQIESKWQDHWEAAGTFEAPNPAGPLAQPEKVAGREKLWRSAGRQPCMGWHSLPNLRA